jgi:hypothetical protein
MWRRDFDPRQPAIRNTMTFPISIVVYPLFGSWRAECKTCGAYANSEGSKYKSPIGEALENLSKRPTTFSENSKGCQHHYGSYKPRVNCQIDAVHLSAINEPKSVTYHQVFNGTSWNQDDSTIAHVIVSNQYHLDVVNKTTPKIVTASKDVEAKLQFTSEENKEDRCRAENELALILERSVTEALRGLRAGAEYHELWYRRLKVISVSLIVFMIGIYLVNYWQFIKLLVSTNDCTYKFCLRL